MPEKGKLYLIPSALAPDGLDAIGMQVRALLPSIQYFLVENVRSSRRFISSLRLGITIEELQFEVLDKKSTSEQMKKYFAPIRSGKDIAVLSEAGCPGVADPGALAVEYAHRQGIDVVPLVGPSSLLLALMGSGFNGQRFTFQGYLPIDKSERAKKIKAIERESVSENMTQLFIETPFRNMSLFSSLISTCSPQTQLCIACNLTASNQWIKTQSIKDWKEKEPELHKLPVVFLIQA